VLIFSLALVVAELLAVLCFFHLRNLIYNEQSMYSFMSMLFTKQKWQNISETYDATWRQNVAADLP
jgi:hypothetical protein